MPQVFNLKLYRSIEHRDICEEFIRGHEEVLRLFGIKKLTSAKTTWLDNPASYMVVARDCQGEMVGGIRIHIDQKGAEPLPLVPAIQEMDPNVVKFVEKHSEKGTGEICGLWNSRKVKGLGVSFSLMKSIITVSTQLKLSTILGLCSPYTLDWLQSVGFTKDNTLGKNGTFYYPKEDLIATTIIVRNTISLDDADEDVREEILNTRKSLVHTTKDEAQNGMEIITNYDLLLGNERYLLSKYS